MESGARRLLRAASEKLELPAAEIAGLPKIELNGFTELVLEHHTGIRDYAQTQIVVGVNLGAVRVEGENLYIHQMNSRRIVLRGSIRQIILDSEVAE